MRQRDLRNAAANRKENAPEGRSKREKKKRKDDDEKSVKSEKRDFFNTFSLRSKRERKRKKKGRLIESKSKREKKKITEKKLTEEKSIRGKKKKVRDFPVTDEQKDNYFNFLTEMFDLGVEGIIKQYQTYLKAYIPPNISHTAFDKNIKKNRYRDVICIDETRVVLQEGQSDYIHANHVKGDPFLNAFICTQGPMSVTVNDFWIMIMQEKVSNIIMLCNIIEAGKNKCFQYWPQEVGSTLTFGDVQVTCAEINENKDTTFVLSILEAENKNIRLNIKHLRWKDWPDRGVPSSVLAPFRILKIVRQSLDRATVVHCSAGIGRTGCIVAIEMSLQQILSGKPLSIIDMVKRLRSMRMSAIQTDEQLVYVVRCLIAYADACGLLNSKPELQEKAEKFANDYTAMLTAKKTITPVEQKIILPEAQPVGEPITVKVEERQEEPSQKSKQSLQDALEPNETALRLNLLKMTLKQPQPFQIFEDQKQLQKIRSEPVLSPSITPIEQPQKVTELAPPPFIILDQKLQKPAETVQSPSTTPIQKPKKTGESAPLPSAIPVQKPHKAPEIRQSPSTTPIQKSQKTGESTPLPSAIPVQKPHKAPEIVQPLPSAIPAQKPHKAPEIVQSPSTTPIQKPQKTGESAPSPSAIPVQKPHKAPEIIQSPSTTPIQKPQKTGESAPSPSAIPVQKPHKAPEIVQSPSTTPIQKPQKTGESAPSPSAIPVQKPHKTPEIIQSPSTTPIQKSQKTGESAPLPSATPVQKPHKAPEIVQSPSAIPIQKSQKKGEPLPLPSTTPFQKSQKVDESILPPSIIPNQQQKTTKSVSSFSATPNQQLQKSLPSAKQKPIQPISSASVIPVQQTQKPIQMVSSGSPLQQPKKQIQPVPLSSIAPVQQQGQIQPVTSPSIAPVQKPQKQASVVMKTDWKQQHQSQIVHPLQQDGRLQHMADRKLKQSTLPLESADSKKLLSKPSSPVASPAASQLKSAQLKPIPTIIAQNKAPNNESNNTKR